MSNKSNSITQEENIYQFSYRRYKNTHLEIGYDQIMKGISFRLASLEYKKQIWASQRVGMSMVYYKSKTEESNKTEKHIKILARFWRIGRKAKFSKDWRVRKLTTGSQVMYYLVHEDIIFFISIMDTRIKFYYQKYYQKHHLLS